MSKLYTTGTLSHYRTSALIRGCADLKRWIDKDREFLLWRQQLIPFLDKWKSLPKDRSAAHHFRD